MKAECQIKLTGKLHQQNKRNGRETFWSYRQKEMDNSIK